jgi:Tfp pilus assembly pilus retraction ATPase PilT
LTLGTLHTNSCAQTMNQSLAGLVQRRKISRDEALNRSTAPEELAGLLTGPSPQAPSPAATAPARSGSVFNRH